MGIIKKVYSGVAHAAGHGAGWLRGRTQRRQAALLRLALGSILLDSVHRALRGTATPRGLRRALPIIDGPRRSKWAGGRGAARNNNNNNNTCGNKSAGQKRTNKLGVSALGLVSPLGGGTGLSALNAINSTEGPATNSKNGLGLRNPPIKDVFICLSCGTGQCRFN